LADKAMNEPPKRVAKVIPEYHIQLDDQYAE
jgi:hypothetical protein